MSNKWQCPKGCGHDIKVHLYGGCTICTCDYHPAPQPAAPAGEDCPCYAQSRSCDKWCPNHSGCKHAPTPPTGTPSIDDMLIEVRHGRMSNTLAKTIIAKAYDARFEAALGENVYPAFNNGVIVDATGRKVVGSDIHSLETSSNMSDHIGFKTGHNALRAEARARWYSPEQGGGDGK